MRRSLAAFITMLAAFAVVPSLASANAASAVNFANALSKLVTKPVYPAFYIPPSPLPDVPPGTLIRAERFNSKLAITKLRPGVEAWRIMYMSTSAVGDPIAVTGVVLVPTNEKPVEGVTNRPLIGYANEAIGLGDNCADSRLLKYGNSGEIALYDPLLKRGYAVVASDYEGLGTPEVHTFGVTVSAAHTMLDSIRAARQLKDADLPADGPLGMFGYSQGGAAVAGAEELAPYYAPELHFTAAAFGGAPSNPISFSKNNDGSLFSSVNFAAAAGYNAAYPELDLTSFLNPSGKAVLADTYNACIESIFPLAFAKESDFLTSDIYTDPRWIARFNQNTLGHIAPQIPTYQWHAIWDEAAPYKDAVALQKQYCAGHTPLRFVPVPLEHVTAGPLWMPTAAKWLAAEIDGRLHDPGNCGYYPPRTNPPPPADGGV
jgi:hypothetical protein